MEENQEKDIIKEKIEEKKQEKQDSMRRNPHIRR